MCVFPYVLILNLLILLNFLFSKMCSEFSPVQYINCLVLMTILIFLGEFEKLVIFNNSCVGIFPFPSPFGIGKHLLWIFHQFLHMYSHSLHSSTLVKTRCECLTNSCVRIRIHIHSIPSYLVQIRCEFFISSNVDIYSSSLPSPLVTISCEFCTNYCVGIHITSTISSRL